MLRDVRALLARCGRCLALACAATSFLSVPPLTTAQEPSSPNPVNPFASVNPVPSEAKKGAIHFSDGRIIRGDIYLTPGLRWRFFDEKTHRYLQLPLSIIERVEAIVEREWMEREWRFKEAGSDVKVYTGRTYPARILRHRVTLRNGRVLEGRGSTVLYVQPEPTPDRQTEPGHPPRPVKVILQERQKGRPGESLKDLVYVKKIEFGTPSEEHDTESPDRPG